MSARATLLALAAAVLPLAAAPVSAQGPKAPGLTVPEEPCRAYVRAVLVGLARSGFRNVILVNGHKVCDKARGLVADTIRRGDEEGV